MPREGVHGSGCKCGAPEETSLILVYHVLERPFLFLALRRIRRLNQARMRRFGLAYERRHYRKGWRRAYVWQPTTAKRTPRLEAPPERVEEMWRGWTLTHIHPPRQGRAHA